jgi:hypothetical protein
LFKELPVSKKIIGKNVQVVLRETVVEDAYRIEVWAHETYVLPNRPYGLGNLELPEEEFSFASTMDSPRAKCFLKGLDASAPLEQDQAASVAR